MRRVVIAPDSFKGSLSAVDVAAAIADGWRMTSPDDELVLLPLADGGEGTLDAVRMAVPGAQEISVRVTGPTGADVDAHWVLLPNGDAIVELAVASGILLLDRDDQGAPQLLPFDAHTLGTGQVMRHAIEAGANRIIVSLGGSCSTDGGSGLLSALGAQFLDAAGGQLPLGNRSLEELGRVDVSNLLSLPVGGLVIWSDVTVPLLGEHGAVRVFGPQKGIEPAAFERAESGLQRLAEVLGADPSTPGAGAAGGTGFGLLWLGATLTGGANAVAELIGLDAQIASADVVITGEGRFDGQSEQGKATTHVREIARDHESPVILVAGEIATPDHGFTHAISLTDAAIEGESPMIDTRQILERVGQMLARRLA